MRINIRKTLQKGKPTIGSWMQLPCPNVAEIMGNAGYDWVAVDLEHGPFSRQTLSNIFRSLEIGGTFPFARIAKASSNNIKQALDNGAHGLILPMIETREQLNQAISCALYPPSGSRGIGYCRANLFGKHFNEYKEKSKETIIVAQIEHIRAVENLQGILSVKGLDAIMVGPYDLSGSMDITGNFEHPDFINVMEEISKKAKQYSIPMGTHIVDPQPDVLKTKIAEGYQFIAYGIDSVFLFQNAECPKYA